MAFYKAEAGIKLNFIPTTNRWLSPDTIIPDPANPQSFNRYGYVNNNPIRYNDPSGHCGADTIQVTNADGSTSIKQDPSLLKACQDIRDPFMAKHGIEIAGEWTFAEMEELITGINLFLDWSGETLSGLIKGIYMDRDWPAYGGYGNADSYRGCFQNVDNCYLDAINPQVFSSKPAIVQTDWIIISGTWNRAYGLGLVGTIIHELAHPYAKKYPSLIDTFVEKKGWGTFTTTSQSWDKVSADASPYSLTRLNSAFAAEEDFADHVARMLAPLEPLHPRYGGSNAAWYYQSSPVDSWIETIPQTR
ncbi:MAG: RHS repeat-associated core domain-containing protein [Anaerolineae bacterium]